MRHTSPKRAPAQDARGIDTHRGEADRPVPGSRVPDAPPLPPPSRGTDTVVRRAARPRHLSASAGRPPPRY